ncbi:MAG: Glycosyl phosphatidyl inositol anchor synthesis [Trizodia sp. TS-e1964]|nr:MAG: Glycosyl phosphatidyl inositol anchor synthesis [Trizodia sp. TS-e1964]
MARINRHGFLAIALVFHLVYIYSIFDIYFLSPIVAGMQAFQVERPEGTQAPASRLVLFVGDGLRADKAFQSFPDPSPIPDDPTNSTSKPLAPFLRSRVLNHGTFGVSHTRVPTESRPGHVALIAGLYEDVSAITTGWKLNPVNFDSVFNRSRHTWSWGSPDILPMFKEGAVEGRVDGESYAEEAEDFTQDATQLDIWVFDKVKTLFASAATNSTLNKALREDKIVFFLHLLGLDTNGHAYRPYSREYLHNIKVVDKGVEEITKLIEDFYADDRTAFVFTADHGMSDWGSHGDGHPDNTRTPLIAWGSGVATPLKANPGQKAHGHEDNYSSDWNLDHITRHDVSQADVAALMAYLAGLEFPVNSVGELPLAYIAGDSKEKAESALANTRGILEMYRVKEGKRKATQLQYKAYPPLGDNEHSVEHRIGEIRKLIDDAKYDEAIAECGSLMKIGLQGLRYLQTYNWLFLRTIVTAGYLGWIAFATTTILDLHVLHGTTEPARTLASSMFFLSILVGLYSILWKQMSPWTYYAYTFFPMIFWEEVYAKRGAISAGAAQLLKSANYTHKYLTFSLQVVAYLALLEAFVQGYINREVFSVCFISAAIWPAFYGLTFLQQNKALISTWAITCVAMSSFTMLPVVKVEDLNLILLGGGLMAITGSLYLFFENEIHFQSSSKISFPSIDNVISRSILGIQIGLIIVAMVVTRSSVLSLQAKKGLPIGSQAVGWIIMVLSIIVPFFHRIQPNNYYLHRLVIIFLTFSPIFVILTISYEGLFYLTFCATLLTWVRLEHRIYQYTSSERAENAKPTTSPSSPTPTVINPSHAISSTTNYGPYRSLTLSDTRIALFFLFLIQSAFFSTGNIASVSSFSLDSVYRLIPVFNPFSQGALLIFKILIPFALISAHLGILNRRIGAPPSAIFMIVMAISDVLTLNFFYLVRDEGSWLQIGATISHFVIASLLCAFVAGLELLSEVFIAGVEVDSYVAVAPEKAGDDSDINQTPLASE